MGQAGRASWRNVHVQCATQHGRTPGGQKTFLAYMAYITFIQATGHHLGVRHPVLVIHPWGICRSLRRLPHFWGHRTCTPEHTPVFCYPEGSTITDISSPYIQKGLLVLVQFHFVDHLFQSMPTKNPTFFKKWLQSSIQYLMLCKIHLIIHR